MFNPEQNLLMCLDTMLSNSVLDNMEDELETQKPTLTPKLAG